MKPKCVLFVDDDPDWREALKGYLARQQLEVISFESAEEAIDYLDQHQDQDSPDLALLDFNLQNGRMNGFDLAKRLRELFAYKNPIVFLSSEPAISSYASQLQSTAALTKKVSFETIALFVDQFIQCFQSSQLFQPARQSVPSRPVIKSGRSPN